MEIQKIINQANRDLASYEAKAESASQSIESISTTLGYDHPLTAEEANEEIAKVTAELSDKRERLEELLKKLETITTGQYE